tara:strand:+ start:58 stop:930 length:873 start_codon:yes stop_codon:yes gene_type:complete
MYSEKIKNHLSEYKFRKLTESSGQWRGKNYTHILPKDQYKLNILEEIREDFWIYFTKNDITPHTNFHHLNSSQAMCFNLFFPLIKDDKKLLTYVIHRILEVRPANNLKISEMDLNKAALLDEKFLNINPINKVEFEKVLDPLEGTNFDLYVELTMGKRVLFEIKYTENEFGSAKKDKRHLNKVDDIYMERLIPLINPEYLNYDFILKHYQIIRNLSFIDENTMVVFLYPKENEKLHYVDSLLHRILKEDVNHKIITFSLENLIRKILHKKIFAHLRHIYQEFEEKYKTNY